MSRLRQFLKKVAGMLADATALADAVDFQSGIVEDGKYLFAEAKVGEYTVRERLPRDILKWPDDRQSAYLDEVTAKLTRKLGMASKDKPVIVAENRHTRRRGEAFARQKTR